MRFHFGASWRAWFNAAAAVLVAVALQCRPAQAGEAAAARPLGPETLAFLDKKNIAAASPVYIRIFKEESELEVWKERPGGRFVLVKTFPVCNWSGALGPKQAIGDLMAPEGFYSLEHGSLNPDSKFHLALNIGYPNALDRALGRSGNFIMVHGDCKSVGCFAMTDGLIEEIYAFVREALDAGQERVPVHIFPFRMTDSALARHSGHSAYPSWLPLKEAYADFGKSRLVPRIAMCGKRYVVNPIFEVEDATAQSAAAQCPATPGKLVAPVSRTLARKLKSEPLVATGVKLRTPANIANWTGSGAQSAAVLEAPPSHSARSSPTDMHGIRPFQR